MSKVGQVIKAADIRRRRIEMEYQLDSFFILLYFIFFKKRFGILFGCQTLGRTKEIDKIKDKRDILTHPMPLESAKLVSIYIGRRKMRDRNEE